MFLSFTQISAACKKTEILFCFLKKYQYNCKRKQVLTYNSYSKYFISQLLTETGSEQKFQNFERITQQVHLKRNNHFLHNHKFIPPPPQKKERMKTYGKKVKSERRQKNQ